MTKKSRSSFCTSERKTRYRDELEAKLVIMTLRKYSERQEVPKRAYYCVHCKGYHLTSQEKRSYTTV